MTRLLIHVRATLVIGWCLVVASSQIDAQEDRRQLSGQLDEHVWKLQIHLSDSEFKALEPSPPQIGFGGPLRRQGQQFNPSARSRESVTNLFGIQFPWVKGELAFESGNKKQSGIPCRVRYDGDFTYTLAAQSPKRPMFVELLEGQTIEGMTSFRLHTMQFDPSMLRERIVSHVFASLNATATRSSHAELSLSVGDLSSEHIGLYCILDAVDASFLQRCEIPVASLLIQTNGLSTIQYAGPQWLAYAMMFRTDRIPRREEQARIIAFMKLISDASEEEFVASIDEFIDTEAFLRYIAASSLTSNVTGMSTLGANDYLCLDGNGKFHVVASQFETSLGGSILSGTPEQLANLRVMRPYAGECKLIDRMMDHAPFRERYLEIIQAATNGFFQTTRMEETIASIEAASAEERQRETAAAEARQRKIMEAFGGGGGTAPGAGGAASAQPPSMDARTFVAKRNESISQQLAGDEPGYTPSIPNFGGFAGGGNRRQGATAPITELQFRDSVQVPKDFVATLFARSPDVNYPVAISAEPTKVIYVASDEQGSLGTDKNGGKILRCVDEDSDGVMDIVTVFCRVDHVRGVVYRAGSVWVSHPPYLSVFHDDDNDGVADRNQQLVSGLTTEMVNSRGGDHTTNGVRMGIDGWLYIGDGDYGVPHAEGTDGSTVVLRGGGILRVRPDGTELELFASGLRNPFDIAIDPQLNLFTRDNTNDGGGWDTRVSQLFQTAEYGYPRLFANFSDEIMPTLGVFGNGGGTGSLYIEDEAWPERLNNSLFTGDWGRSAVFHHPLQENGPTFELTQRSFANIPRATGMDLDAQGNLFVASWWSGEASVYVGPHVGFVTRLSPKDSTSRTFPTLPDATLAEVVELLRSPNAVSRFHAQGELLQRGAQAVDPLTRTCQDSTFPLHGRIAALFALKQIQGSASHELLKRLTDDASIREYAIRALTDRKSQIDGLDANYFVTFLSDESPRVRAQALIALHRLGDANIADHIIPLATQASEERPDPAQPNADQVLPHLALQTLIELNAVDACLAALEGPYRTAALRALRSMYDVKAIDGLISQLARERDANRRSELLTVLIRLYQQESSYDGSWWGIRPDTTGPFYDPTTWAQSERIASVLSIAIQEADEETSNLLRSELVRHQVELPGIVSMDQSIVAEEKPVTIDPVDPGNPNQVGNKPYSELLAQSLAIKGNAANGGKLFESRSCTTCHTSAAGQKPIGPHLADIGKRYKPDELIESIVKPSEKIAQGYETQAFLLDSGKVFTGFVTSEKGDEILIRDSQGITHRIARDEIEDRSRQPISAMPEGLVGSLTITELADLIAYLKSL